MRFFPSMSDTIRWVASPGTRMIDALVFGGFAGVSRRGFAGVRCTDVCQVASGVMTPKSFTPLWVADWDMFWWFRFTGCLFSVGGDVEVKGVRQVERRRVEW